MSNDKKKKCFFCAVTNKEGIAYSNFVYSLCAYVIKERCSEYYDVDEFVRHDMLTVDNIKNSVYNCLVGYDTIIFLADTEGEGYNPNVWFELGLASTQREKNIILISKKKELPFYASNVQVIQIKKFIMNKLCDYKSMYDTTTITEEVREQWYANWSEIHEEQNVDLKKCLDEFGANLESKMRSGGNPFKRDNDFADIIALGYGDVYNLLERVRADNYVIAEFIQTERGAFEALTKSVREAKNHLRTTRFANRSIVTGKGGNAGVHENFMVALCEASKKIGRSERIICNNHYSKWRDIYRALLDGGNIRVYIRKKVYSIGFELVIVDNETTFIHFYQLSENGNRNTDGTENERWNEVINSTLRLQGKEVGSNMVNIFQRLYQRSEGDPSRTLLGIPLESKKVELNEEKNYGYLELNLIPTENPTKRGNRIIELFIDKFEKWYDNIDDFDDLKNFVFGVWIVLHEVGRLTLIKSMQDYIKKKKGDENKYRLIVQFIKSEMSNNRTPDDDKKIYFDILKELGECNDGK